MKKEVNRYILRAIESSVIILSLETDYVDPSVCWRESESVERRRDQRGKRNVRARGLGNMIEVEVGEME